LTTNEYVFAAANSSTHISGYHELLAVQDLVKKRDRVTATIMRHYLSTLREQTKSSSRDDARWYEHMGHTKNTNKEVYQCPPALSTLVNVGKFLLEADEPGMFSATVC